MALTRSAIMTAALTILDEYGLADLSMRRIAGALGAAPAALYWHFDNKQSLLAGLAGEVLAGLTGPQDVTRAGLERWCHEFRDRLITHRDGAELVSSVLAMRLLPDPPTDVLAQSLTAAGFPIEDAHAAAGLVVHFLLGHSMDRQGYAQSLQLGVAGPPGPDPEAGFAYGVRVLAAALLPA